MNTLNCLVVDDEELARLLLEQHILKIPGLELVAKCKNPLETLPYLENENIDLIFLDIQMPELTGIEFLKTMPRRPLVVFTTAYPQYALEGYELDVLDYLVKPIRFERFLQAVQKARNRLKPKEESRVAPAPPSRDYLLVKAAHKVYKLRFDQIRYIQGMQEYVAFHTADGRILSLNSLKKLESELPPDKFIRVHKSYIASIDQVRSLEGNQLNLGTEKIPIGSSYREEVLKRVFRG